MAKSHLFAASSAAALVAAALPAVACAQAAAETPTPVAAPATATATAEEGDIVVTGSRIAVAGYQQPTPVTVVNEAVIQRDARVSIGDTIRELPAVGTSASPNNSVGAGGIVAGATGLDTVNLRQLGYLRTLTLFDGQRVVQSNITGQVDIATIPTMLVQRVDVVTAGASAAWGSDAVAGVVNLVLNKSFDGIRVSADYGDTTRSDHRSYRLQGAIGSGFAEDRGRVIAAVSYLNSPETVFAGNRSWNRYPALMENPAYTATNDQPRYVHVSNIGLSQATTGGLIASGPLRGTQFVGPNATPVPFNFGQVSGPLSYGGDGEQLNASVDNLAVEFRSLSAFGYTSYAFADWLKASVQLNYGTTRSRNNSVPVTRFGNLNIRIDNAYLPESVKARMRTAGVTTVPVGTTNLNNLAPGQKLDLDYLEDNTVAVPVAVTKRALKRGVFSLDGDLGGDWKWNAYYQYGRVKVNQETTANLIPGNFNLAIDAVVAPAGNAAGIAAGTVVCRSTLTSPSNGCAPLNIFGTGVASQEAIRYVNVKPGQNYQVQRLTQEVYAASVQGKLPFGLPAGQVAVAFGAEHRTEKGNVVADEGAINRLYALGNFAPFEGEYNVKEAFLEAEVPILKDSFLSSLSLNAAGRLTDYSTSGSVKTWKLGLTSDLNSDIRLRGTISRDIRAPILNELFSSGVATSGSAVDPRTGLNVPIFTFASGNRDLTPEIAKTYSAGIVLRPGFLPRFNLSLDYYKISIEDAIASINANQVLLRCNAGETAFCDQLVFAGPNGALSQINTFPRNVSSLKVEGIDFQSDYTRPFAGGDIGFRLLGTYMMRQSQDQLGVKVNYAGAIGPDNPVSGIPKARATFSTTYNQDGVSLTGQVRFIGAAKLVDEWTSKDVDRNKIDPIAYVDLRASYQLNDAVQLYGTLDNLLDQAPPLVPGTAARGQTVYYYTAVRGDIYDILGRSYRVGVRVRF